MDNTKDVAFSGNFLSINDKTIDINAFKNVIPENTYSITESTRVHIYNFHYQENYLKVTFGDGSAMPRNPNVVDITTNETIPNPRQANQVEPRETFGVIDFNTGYLWLSNSKKRSSILNFLRNRFRHDLIVCKDVYSEEEFINVLRKLDNLKISVVPNLLSQSNSLTRALSEEINGYNSSTATLIFHYKNTPIGFDLRQKISNIFKNIHTFNSIVVSGRDEKNLGMLFNSEGFSRKIEIKALVDENEMFLPDDVFSKVIKKIEDENN